MFSLYIEMRSIFIVCVFYISHTQAYYITWDITKALCLDKKKKRGKKSILFLPSAAKLALFECCSEYLTFTILTKTGWRWSLERTGPCVTSQASQTPFAFSRHFLWKSANPALCSSSGWCTVLTCSPWALPEVNIINNFFK